jgi:membrane-associated phospholipid phosphatase
VEKESKKTTPAPVRRYRAVLFVSGLLVLVAAFTVLSILASRADFFPIDLRVTRFIQSMDDPVAAALMNGISWVGYAPQSFVFIVLVAGLLAIRGLHWEALVCVLAAVFEGLLNTLVKVIIHRPRPAADLVHVVKEMGSYSFPSGHVMFYTCFFGFLLFLVFTLMRHSWKRTALLAVIGSQVLLIGVSRIYLGEHWASDAVGAYLLGFIALVGVIEFYRWGKPRFFTRQPVA